MTNTKDFVTDLKVEYCFDVMFHSCLYWLLQIGTFRDKLDFVAMTRRQLSRRLCYINFLPTKSVILKGSENCYRIDNS